MRAFIIGLVIGGIFAIPFILPIAFILLPFHLVAKLIIRR